MKRICLLSAISLILLALIPELVYLSKAHNDISNGILVKYGTILNLSSLFFLFLTAFLKKKFVRAVVYVCVLILQFLYWNIFETMQFIQFISSILILSIYHVGLHS